MNRTPRASLFDAVEISDADLTARLLGNELDANEKDACSRTPLHYACEKGYAGSVRTLLELGADVNARSISCNTPLHYACKCGRYDIANLLVANGADINAVNDCGRTPLHETVLIGRPPYFDIALLLLGHGADAVAKDKDGEMLLDNVMLALHEGEEEREMVIEYYKNHHPEVVFEKWCTMQGRSIHLPPDPKRP